MKPINLLLALAIFAGSSLALAEGGADRTVARIDLAREASQQVATQSD